MELCLVCKNLFMHQECGFATKFLHLFLGDSCDLNKIFEG